MSGSNGHKPLVEQEREVVRVRIGDIHVDGEYPGLLAGGRYQYPRGRPDWHYVTGLKHALQHGARLGPIVLSPDLHHIDGMMRLLAQEQLYGPDGTVEAVLRDLSRAEALECFAVANGRHGRLLDHVDLVRIATIAETVGLSTERLAEVLCVSVEKIQQLRGETVWVKQDDGSVIVGAAKTWMAHRFGDRMTQVEYRALQQVADKSPRVHANSLRLCMEHNLINRGDGPTMTALDKLGVTLAADAVEKRRVCWDDQETAGVLLAMARAILRQYEEHEALLAGAPAKALVPAVA